MSFRISMSIVLASLISIQAFAAIDYFNISGLSAGRGSFSAPSVFVNNDFTRGVVYKEGRVEYWQLSPDPVLIKAWSSSKIFSVAYQAQENLLALGYENGNRVEVYKLGLGRVYSSAIFWNKTPVPDQTEAKRVDLVDQFNWAAKFDKPEVRTLAFNQTGNLLSAISYHGQGVIRDVENRRTVKTFDVGGTVMDSVFSDDGKQLFVASRGADLSVVSVRGRGRTQEIYPGTDHEMGFFAGPFTAPDNGLLVSPRFLREASDVTKSDYAVVRKEDGKVLFGVPMQFDSYQLGELAMIPGRDGFAFSLVQKTGLHGREGTLAFVGIWDGKSAKPKIVTQPVPGRITSLTASEKYIFAGTSGGDIVAWNLITGKLEASVEIQKFSSKKSPFQGTCSSAVASLNGQGLVIGFPSGEAASVQINQVER